MTVLSDNKGLQDGKAREQALDLNQHVLVQAPAGSGKTGLLVQRMLACLATADEPEQVLAITFTNKAAAEMRVRISQALHSALSEQPAEHYLQKTWQLASAVLARDEVLGWGLLNNPGRVRAQTIDSLNRHLAAQVPLLSGLGGIGAGAEQPELIYQQAIMALFDELDRGRADEPMDETLQVILRWAGNRLDRLIKPLSALLAQRDQWAGPVLQALNGDDERNLDEVLITLVQDRLSEAQEALPKNLAEAFISLLGEAADPDTLPWVAELAGWPEPVIEKLHLWRVLADLLLTKSKDATYRKQLNKTAGVPSGNPGYKEINALLGEWVASDQAEAFRLCLIEIRQLPDPAYPQELVVLCNHLIRLLHHLLGYLRLAFAQRGEVDFTEVAQRAIEALRQGDTYTPVLERQDHLIRHLLVDEMQDTSQGQIELLKLLTLGWLAGDGRSLFMVGDPKQSIYAFRQANVRLFIKLWEDARFEQLPLQCLELSSNFRSSAKLVEWFNEAFNRAFPAESDQWTGEVAYSPSSAVIPAEDPHGVRLYPTLGRDDTAEAAEVVGAIKTLQAQGNTALSEIAILVRSRNHLSDILPALRHAGIAYRCTDIDPLGGNDAVADALALIHALSHRFDRTAWAVLLRSPLVGLSWADMLALKQVDGVDDLSRIDHVVGQQADMSPEGVQQLSCFRQTLDSALGNRAVSWDINRLAPAMWQALGGLACCDTQQYADVQRLFRLLKQHSHGGELEDRQAFDLAVDKLYASPTGEGVQLMTIHKAKGLEFDHVFLVGLGRKTGNEDKPMLAHESLPDGMLLCPDPGDAASEPAQRLYDYTRGLGKTRRKSENLRLLYVAVTRARKTLHLLGHANVLKSGDLKPESVSFLNALWTMLEAEYLACSDQAVAEKIERWVTPVSPRLPAGWAQPQWSAPWTPPVTRTLRASGQAGTAENKAGDYATLVGEMYHAAMQRMVEQGELDWSAESNQQAMRSGLRRLGLPEPDVEKAVTRVIALLEKTLASESGRWLLQKRDWVKAEYAVSGVLEGRPINTFIDLCFEDGNQLWIIDYKAAAEPVDAEDIDNYLQYQKMTYADQLDRYARLLMAHRGAEQIRKALFLPELGRLVEL